MDNIDDEIIEINTSDVENEFEFEEGDMDSGMNSELVLNNNNSFVSSITSLNMSSKEEKDKLTQMFAVAFTGNKDLNKLDKREQVHEMKSSLNAFLGDAQTATDGKLDDFFSTIRQAIDKVYDEAAGSVKLLTIIDNTTECIVNSNTQEGYKLRFNFTEFIESSRMQKLCPFPVPFYKQKYSNYRDCNMLATNISFYLTGYGITTSFAKFNCKKSKIHDNQLFMLISKDSDLTAITPIVMILRACGRIVSVAAQEELCIKDMTEEQFNRIIQHKEEDLQSLFLVPTSDYIVTRLIVPQDMKFII